MQCETLFVIILLGFAAISAANRPFPVTTPAPEKCPAPTDEMVACVQQWPCQNLLRLDLRCLLNLNGLPLVGGLLGGGSGNQQSTGGTSGASGGGLLGGPGGILGSLLG